MNMKECRHGPVRKDDDDVVDWIEGGCSFGAYGGIAGMVLMYE